MKKVVAALGILAVVGVARADGGTGPTFGARLGYGVSMGDAQTGLSLSDYAGGTIPVVVEAGFRFTKQLSACAYFQYAHATSSAR